MILRAKAHAKVNLHLEVLHRREDGYHEVETILQSVGLHDTLHLRRLRSGIKVRCDHPGVPLDRTNLCWRAARALRAHTGVRKGVQIDIHKRIPVAAGLGGGSADAAACLLALPRLWDVQVEPEELHALAARLGADVPFFLRGGTQLARGVGEVLTPLSASGGGWYLIITPRIELSTAWVYEHLRMGLTHAPPKVNLANYKSLLARFPERPWPGFNRLGDVVLPAFPALHRLLLQLQDSGARLAMLSGSGPSLFAVYLALEETEKAKESVDVGEAFTWIGRSTNFGVEIDCERERSPDPGDQ
jgi:4-diphosphocytidyl-2-C-methyl-D-erythritol kinase